MSARALAARFLSVTVMRIGIAMLNFGLFWVMSHRLGVAALGGFAWAMNLFFLLQALPLLGLQPHLTRSVAAQPVDTAALARAALWFGLPWGAAMAAGLVAYAVWAGDPSWRLALSWLALSLLPTVWTLTAEAVLVGRERLRAVVGVNLAESAWRVMTAAWLVAGDGDLDTFMACFCAGRWVAAGAYALHPLLRRAAPAGRTRSRHALATHAPTFLAITLVTALATRLDLLLLPRLVGAGAAGVYAAAARVNDAALLASTMMLVVVFPVLSRWYVHDRARFLALMARTLRWAIVLGLPGALAAMALAPWVIGWLYPAELQGAVPVLQVLLLAAWWMTIDQLLSTAMLAAQAQRADLQCMLVGLVALVPLLLVLSMWQGAPGAAAAVVLALVLRVMARLAWAQRALPVAGLVGLGGRCVLAACVAVAVFAWLQPWQGVGLAVLAAALAYALVLRLLGGWQPAHADDCRAVANWWRARRQGGPT